jgi:hypothetical protein
MVEFVKKKLGAVPMTMDQAKAWMVDFLASVKEGGHWAIPRAKSIYRIDHARKAAVRVAGDGDKATEEVLAAIGWTVLTEPDESGSVKGE